jgi:hypothetical protein
VQRTEIHVFLLILLMGHSGATRRLALGVCECQLV